MGGAINSFTAIGKGAMDIVASGKKNTSDLNDLQAEMRDALGSIQQANQAEVDIKEKARWNEGILRMKASQLVGQQRVVAASSGADTQVGTAANVMADTRLMSEFDAKQVQNNAMREAWGHTQEAYTAGRRLEKTRKKYQDVNDSGLLEGIGIAMSAAGEAGQSGAGGMGGGM